MEAAFLYTCPFCLRECRNQSGLTQHINSCHREITPEANDLPKFTYNEHTWATAQRCKFDGQPLPLYSPPPPIPPPNPNRWHPFQDRVTFDFAYQEYVVDQSSIKSINQRLETWAASLLPSGRSPPWRNAKDMYATIDEIQHGPSPWKVIKLQYTGDRPPNPPKWMSETYELCLRDTRNILHSQLTTPTFRDDINYVPYQQFNENGGRVWSNLMSGDWAWRQADLLRDIPNTYGSMFVPIIIGSDKTTVSVATGHQQYHPVYTVTPKTVANKREFCFGAP